MHILWYHTDNVIFDGTTMNWCHYIVLGISATLANRQFFNFCLFLLFLKPKGHFQFLNFQKFQLISNSGFPKISKWLRERNKFSKSCAEFRRKTVLIKALMYYNFSLNQCLHHYIRLFLYTLYYNMHFKGLVPLQGFSAKASHMAINIFIKQRRPWKLLLLLM